VVPRRPEDHSVPHGVRGHDRACAAAPPASPQRALCAPPLSWGLARRSHCWHGAEDPHRRFERELVPKGPAHLSEVALTTKPRALKQRHHPRISTEVTVVGRLRRPDRDHVRHAVPRSQPPRDHPPATAIARSGADDPPPGPAIPSTHHHQQGPPETTISRTVGSTQAKQACLGVPPAEVKASGPRANPGTRDTIPAPHSANSAHRVTKPLELEAPPSTPSIQNTPTAHAKGRTAHRVLSPWSWRHPRPRRLRAQPQPSCSVEHPGAGALKRQNPRGVSAFAETDHRGPPGPLRFGRISRWGCRSRRRRAEPPGSPWGGSRRCERCDNRCRACRPPPKLRRRGPGRRPRR